MERPNVEYEVLDCDSRESRRRLQMECEQLRGDYKVTLKPIEATRRQKANAYYFGVVIRLWNEYLNSQNTVHVSKGRAHYLLKKYVWPLDPGPANPVTGEVEELVVETHRMSIPQFYDFVERCRVWLVEHCDINTPDPDPDFAQHREAVTP